MSNFDTKKFLERFKKELKEKEMAMDRELARKILGKEYAECGEALVQSLERVRTPVRSKLFEQYEKILNSHNERMTDTERRLREGFDAIIGQVTRFTDFNIELDKETAAEFEHHAGAKLSEEEITRRLDLLLKEKDRKRKEFQQKLEEERAGIEANMPYVGQELEASLLQVEEEGTVLLEEYVSECFELSTPIYEEFVT